MKLLEGRNAVVLNADSALGRSVVLRLNDEGASVFCGTKSQFDFNRQGICCLPMDIEDGASVEAFCDMVKERCSQDAVSVLVNNPDGMPEALAGKTSLLDYTEADDSMLLQIHQRSIMQTERAFWAGMKQHNLGSIVNISSTAAFTRMSAGEDADPMFAAAKAASGGLTRVCAFEGGFSNIRCNEVLADIPEAEHTEAAEAVADLVVFLASDMSSYITGQTIKAKGVIYGSVKD